MQLIWLALPLVLVFASPVAAASRAILIGGSGEVEVENFLIQDLRRIQASLVERGWRVTAAAGARAGLVGNSQTATIAHIENTLREGVAQLQKSDQLLVLIHSHGRERDPSLGQLTHSIVAQDEGPEGSDLGYDLDRLAPYLLQARARGATTAVVDLSCYSGTIHALTHADCTASLAAPDYVSSCSGRPEERLFTSFFFALPSQDISLEAQFMRARQQDQTSVNLPQISSRLTPAAKGWLSFLTAIDPLDVYGDLEELRIGSLTFSPNQLTPFAPEAERSGLTALLEPILQTRRELEKRMPDLRRHQEGPLQLLALAGRQVPVSPGRLGDWLENLEDPKAASDLEQRVLTDLKAARNQIEPRWAPFVNPYLEAKVAYGALRERLAEQAGALFAWERDFYTRHSRASGRGKACNQFSMGAAN